MGMSASLGGNIVETKDGVVNRPRAQVIDANTSRHARAEAIDANTEAIDTNNGGLLGRPRTDEERFAVVSPSDRTWHDPEPDISWEHKLSNVEQYRVSLSGPNLSCSVILEVQADGPEVDEQIMVVDYRKLCDQPLESDEDYQIRVIAEANVDGSLKPVGETKFHFIYQAPESESLEFSWLESTDEAGPTDA
jgi:hypothetical protein